MFKFSGEYPAVHAKAKFWHFLLKNCKKSAVKHSIEKSYFAQFCEFAFDLLSKIVVYRHFTFCLLGMFP